MSQFELILFDLDGTLLDSRADIANCVNYTLADLGLETLSHEHIYKYVGHGVRQLIEGVVQEAHGKEKYSEAMRIFDDHYMAHLLDETRLMPGMDQVLDACADKACAVITNKPQKYTDPIIDGLGLRERFYAVHGREKTQFRKPHPQPVLKLLEMNPVPKEKALIIGDTEVDIQAGKNAGIKTCGVLFGFGSHKIVEAASPDYLVETAKEIISIL